MQANSSSQWSLWYLDLHPPSHVVPMFVARWHRRLFWALGSVSKQHHVILYMCFDIAPFVVTKSASSLCCFHSKCLTLLALLCWGQTDQRSVTVLTGQGGGVSGSPHHLHWSHEFSMSLEERHSIDSRPFPYRKDVNACNFRFDALICLEMICHISWRTLMHCVRYRLVYTDFSIISHYFRQFLCSSFWLKLN